MRLMIMVCGSSHYCLFTSGFLAHFSSAGVACIDYSACGTSHQFSVAGFVGCSVGISTLTSANWHLSNPACACIVPVHQTVGRAADLVSIITGFSLDHNSVPANGSTHWPVLGVLSTSIPRGNLTANASCLVAVVALLFCHADAVSADVIAKGGAVVVLIAFVANWNLAIDAAGFVGTSIALLRWQLDTVGSVNLACWHCANVSWTDVS